MKKQNLICFPLAIILITSLACNFGKAAPRPITKTATLIPTPQQSSETPVAIPQVVTVAPPVSKEPLPSGYYELFLKRTTSKEWTQEEGLVKILKVFIGETRASDAGLKQAVKETEGTGIFKLAVEYLRSGTDQTTKNEITRLLKIIAPSQKTLDLYSIPEEQANLSDGRSNKLADQPRPSQKQCEELWNDGFPDERTPSFPCFLFGKREIAGNSYQVYYPLAWRGETSKYRYYRATLDAVQDSISLYQTFGDVKPIYFVFTTLHDAEEISSSPTAALTADQYFDLETEACPVIIFPPAMADSIPVFKQTIAHEILHCFQDWNLSNQSFGGSVDALWWLEGSAEYFSNLVYPAVNSEQDWAQSFSELSTMKPLTNLTYENFAFFQFLGNQIEPEGVISLLGRMPTTPGRDAQIAALAAVPGMQDTFEQFVISILDHTLKDSDGNIINFPEYFSSEYVFTNLNSNHFSGHPFVASRYQISFASEKNFTVESISAGDGRSGWRASRSIGGWGPLPATAAAGCDDLPYFLYVITTTPGAERTETVTTTSISDAPCDRCLIGRWEATNASSLAYMQAVVAAGGENVPSVESVTGTMFMEFEADATGAGGYENFKVHEKGAGGVVNTEVDVTFEGFSSGPYTADGTSLKGLNETLDILVTVKIPNLGSTTVPFRQEDFPVGASIPTRYQCEGDTLTLWPPADAATSITYIRTSP